MQSTSDKIAILQMQSDQEKYIATCGCLIFISIFIFFMIRILKKVPSVEYHYQCPRCGDECIFEVEEYGCPSCNFKPIK